MGGWVGGRRVDFGMDHSVFLVDGCIEIGQSREGRPEEAIKGMNEIRIGGLAKMADNVRWWRLPSPPCRKDRLFFSCCCGGGFVVCVCVCVCVCVSCVCV